MKYMENTSSNEWLPEAFSKTQIQKMRAEIAYELFDSNKYMPNQNRTTTKPIKIKTKSK